MLADAGLAACVNIFAGMTAIYIWDGKRRRETEAAMLIKTRAARADAAMAEARKLHPYTDPALMILPVQGGSADFQRGDGRGRRPDHFSRSGMAAMLVIVWFLRMNLQG